MNLVCDESYLEIEKILDYREEEVNEVMDDINNANEAIAAAAVETENLENDAAASEAQNDVATVSDEGAKAGAASAGAIAAGNNSTLASGSAAGGLTTRRSEQSLAAATDDDSGAANGVGAVAKSLSASQQAVLVFQPVERCRKVLEKLCEDPYSVSFLDPVDTATYNDYLDVVEEPMCLEDVRAKLDAGTCIDDSGRRKRHTTCYSIKKLAYFCVCWSSFVVRRVLQVYGIHEIRQGHAEDLAEL